MAPPSTPNHWTVSATCVECCSDPDVPVIVVTARGEEVDRVIGLVLDQIERELELRVQHDKARDGRRTEIAGAIELPSGMEMVMPGDNVEMGVELIVPVAIKEGLRFAIREGGRTVGAGVVTKILE